MRCLLDFSLLVSLSLLVRAGTGLPDAVALQVDPDTTFQEMDGFGCSQAFGRAEDIYNAVPSAQKATLDYLYSPTRGAGFTILRNRIGSNSNASGDTIEPNPPAGGTPNGPPEYVWDGYDSAQVWLSQKAVREYDVKYVYADAWSAPWFMKTNRDESFGGYLCGVSGEPCSSGDWRQAYANLIVKYIQDYNSVGIKITHVGFLNEPEFNASYSSMLSSGTQAADFIKVLSPTLRKAGLSRQVLIACCDSEGWDNQKIMTSEIISAGVEDELGIVTSHSYVTRPDTPILTSRKVWETEFADLDGVWNTNWYINDTFGEGFYWAKLIYNGIVNANLSAYLYWEGAEANARSNSCLVSITNTTVTPSARLWAMAQWSRYVRPGARRISTTASGSFAENTLTSAFKNVDGTTSVQVLNTGNSSQPITISVRSRPTGGNILAAEAFVSNQSNGGVPTPMKVSSQRGVIGATVPAFSMTTFIYH